MQKLLKYVPSGNPRTPIVFPSSKGNVAFEFVGDEKTVTQEQFEALQAESSEFKTCLEMRVVVTSNISDKVVKAGEKQTEKELTDTDEQLSATPKKSTPAR